MASRRRRSSRARSGAARRATAPAEGAGVAATPKTGAARTRTLQGTKQTVPCPACGTEYRIPNELLDQQLQCRNCARAFTPSKASKRRIRGQSNATPFIVGGAILVFMIVGGLLITWRPSSTATATATGGGDAPKAVETGMRNPRVREVHDWTVALTEGDAFGLTRRSSFSKLRTAVGIENIDGAASDVQDRVLKALLEGEQAKFFRDSEVTSATIEERDAEAKSGKVRVFLAVEEDKRREWSQSAAEVWVQFEMVDGRPRVTGWHPDTIPAAREVAASRGGKDFVADDGTTRRRTGHDVIQEEVVREREYGGEKVVVREAELAPLPHLEDTPPELRQEIDGMIAQLLDIDGPGAAATRATNRLKAIGKPAIPRLLNALYETPMDSQDNILRLNRVTATLYDMTGQRFGFSPGAIQSVDAATAQEDRQSALRQWYAWWASNSWREKFDFAIDDDEEVLESDPRDSSTNTRTTK